MLMSCSAVSITTLIIVMPTSETMVRRFICLRFKSATISTASIARIWPVFWQKRGLKIAGTSGLFGFRLYHWA